MILIFHSFFNSLRIEYDLVGSMTTCSYTMLKFENYVDQWYYWVLNLFLKFTTKNQIKLLHYLFNNLFDVPTF